MSEDSRHASLFEQLGQILIRRRRIVLLALVIPMAGATGLAQFLPKSYRSTSVVIVERGAGVSDDDVDERLRALKSENLGRKRLRGLIERFKLYQDGRSHRSIELLIDQMQKDVVIEFDNEERGGRNIVVGIRVTYTAPDPASAANVANELGSFYEREDLRMREHHAAYTRDKLRGQLAEAREQLDEQEARLKDYKMTHLSELPEQVGLHLAALEQLNSRISASRIEPNPPPVPSGRRPSGAPVERDARLDQLRELETRFTDVHPDVKRLKREIAMLPYVATVDGFDEAPPATADPEQSAARTAAVNRARVEDVRRKVETLRQTAAMHERGILNAPFRQQELEALLPDYVAARTRFQSLSEKYEIAQLRDPRHDDGRLRVLDPAVPRPESVAPNVPRIMAVGIALSLAILVCAVGIVERIDTSFHTVGDLRAFTNLPVLASVPLLVTSTDTRRASRGRIRFAAVVLLLVGSLFAGAAYIGRADQALITGAAERRP